MTTAYYFLINTPVWVFILFAYLIFIGYKSSKTRVVSLKKLFIAPIVFTLMSIHSMIHELQGDYWMALVWLLGMVIGASLGWLQVHRLKPQVDKQHWLVHTQGSWVTMILVILIFGYKYYLGYITAVQPDIITHTGFLWSSLIIIGAITGMFVGRLLYYIRCFYVLPSVDLKES